ncbi:PREDICTED: cadherin EGF LAG seven-pass G-type receptor 2-like [Priapulus caudatus]|uniref:Cadherin EGF LAG seven-pass G-type receptor 2-like n=1 Tax=Priapulus caudatus TaxID=37621 RepID=A0ABM1F061_PRICU|nr:PREDICTED: cadherin EGF LAG seven-pass G-type receptor 2-like [Priapulus caudatus]
MVITCCHGYAYMQVAATDHDSEAYGDVMYAIVHVSAAATDKFSINPQSGLIQVLPSAVMQRGATYSITVQAADGAQGAMQRVSQAIVEVTVQASAAQSAPYFEIVNYTVAVSEGTPVGTPLVKLQARDLDGDTVSYEIYPPNTDFAVDADTGVVTIQRPLDYEELSVRHLSVRANDRKTMPVS